MIIDHFPSFRSQLEVTNVIHTLQQRSSTIQLLSSVNKSSMQSAFLPVQPVRPFLYPVLTRAVQSPSHKPPNFTTTTRMSAAAPPDLGVAKILFAKAAPDGALGDCPFTWKANLALNFRNVDFQLHTIDLSNKPDWFLDLNDAGTTPVFVDQTHAIGDSDEIVEYADRIGHGPNLVREDDPNWDAAFDACSPIFGSMVRLLKNKDDAEEAALRDALNNALYALDQFLAKVDGPFLLGDTVSGLDCNLAPKLQHLSVAASHYKKFEIPSDCNRVISYLDSFKETEQWKKTSCSDDVILWGWSKFFS